MEKKFEDIAEFPEESPEDIYANLRPIERDFVDFYRGNATQALIDAGFPIKEGESEKEYRLRTRKSAYRLTMKSRVQAALATRPIRERTYQEDLDKIADRQDIEIFWTEVMESDENDLGSRIRCSENLAKAQGMFIERKIIEGGADPIRMQTVSKIELEDRIFSILGDEFK